MIRSMSQKDKSDSWIEARQGYGWRVSLGHAEWKDGDQFRDTGRGTTEFGA